MPLPQFAEMFYGIPLTDEQREYANSVFDHQLTIIDAPAGTGKTTVAVGCAKIIGRGLNYIFAPVAEGEMGHRPGDQAEKNEAYLTPLFDALDEIGTSPKEALYDPRLAPALNRNAWVNAMPHTFLRGSNFKNGVTTIVDEAQNYTLAELRKVLTRVKDGKIILIGNLRQCDIGLSRSGFKEYYDFFKDKPYASYPQLTHNFRGQLAKDADEL